MGFIVLIICVMFLLFSILKLKKNIFSPAVLFFLLWTFILFLSNLGLYNIIRPKWEAYFLIMLMLVFFFLGYFINEKYKLISKFKIKRVNLIKNERNEETLHIPKYFYLICYILMGLLLLFLLIDSIIVVKYILKGTPMYIIRNWTLEPYGSINPILSRRTFFEDVFRTMLLTPFSNIITPIIAYIFFNDKKNKNRIPLIILSVVNIVLSSMAGGGGRLGFIYYFGCFALSFIVFLSSQKEKKEKITKYGKYMFFCLIGGLTIVILYTILRAGKGNLFKQIYTYFAMPPTLLSLWLPKIQVSHHFWGLITFFGVHSYFFRFFDTIGLTFLVPNIYNEAYQQIVNAEVFINAGFGMANAFVSPIYYFYLDGGPIFVCLASLFFGLIVSYIYTKFLNNINLKNFVMYALLMYGVFLTFIRIQTAIPSYIISFVLLYLIFKVSSLMEKVWKK